MRLKDFQTILVPSNKNGALQFYHKPTKAILEASFSAPNIGSTSGRTVTRNGQFLELGENDPDWDDANGCPKILMRPQVQNFADEAQGYSPYSGCTISSTTETNPFGDSTGVVRASWSGFGGFRATGTTGLVSGTNYVLGYPLKFDGAAVTLTFEITGLTSYGTFSFDASGQPSSTSNVKFASLSNGFYFVYIEITPGASVTSRLNLINGSGSVLIYEAMYAIQASYESFIPWDFGGLTRSANNFTFDDLVTKGVIDSSGDFSIAVKMFLFDTVTFQGDVIEFLNGANVKRIEISKYNSARLRALNLSDTWFTPLTASGEGNKSFVLTFKGSTKEAKVYFQGALQGSTIIPDNIESIKLSAKADTLFNLNGGDVMFHPVTLTEAQALAALAEL